MIYLKLFLTFFKIGLFNFGGGYAMISFIQNEVVYRQRWLSTAEFTDIVAISQVTPGPVGINMATYAGYMATESLWGAFVATGAVCLPSFLLMWLLGSILLRYRNNYLMRSILTCLRLAVIGLIASAALVLCNGENFVDYKSFLIFIASFVAVWKYKAGPVPVVICCGLLGLFMY